MSKKIIIVGGVAGGASCAARLRRLDESAEIVMVERGPYISFANCGLPYHLSGVIEEREDLLVTTAEDFEARFDVRVMTKTEAIDIDPKRQIVQMRCVESGELFEESYDALVLSPGAAPIRPPFATDDLRGVFVLRNIPDLDRILDYFRAYKVRHATVIGGGFIGIEVAENFAYRGIEVSLVERGSQLMPMLDIELARPLQSECARHGVEVLTDSSVTNIEERAGRLAISLDDDRVFQTDLVIVAVGVAPETDLAKRAGLKIGGRRGILVDETMRTSDPNIFAVGDAIELIDRTTGESISRPLAGPANRQGRLVADIIAGRSQTYRGALGTSILKVFDLHVACTGMTEEHAIRTNTPHRVAWIHGYDHASYYPDATKLTLKLIFHPDNGRILGGQVLGKQGVDKRTDVLATALAAKMTVFDLETIDLAYAPPFSSAKDPINQIGAVASGMIRGDHPTISWKELDTTNLKDAFLLDARDRDEYLQGHIPGAVQIPLNDLREHLTALPPDKKIIVYCQEGLRGYLATRILMQNDFDACNLLGGYRLWCMAHGCGAIEYDSPVSETRLMEEALDLV